MITDKTHTEEVPAITVISQEDQLARIFHQYHGIWRWTDGHSRSYGLREDQAQWYMNKPKPG